MNRRRFLALLGLAAAVPSIAQAAIQTESIAGHAVDTMGPETYFDPNPDPPGMSWRPETVRVITASDLSALPPEGELSLDEQIRYLGDDPDEVARGRPVDRIRESPEFKAIVEQITFDAWAATPRLRAPKQYDPGTILHFTHSGVLRLDSPR